MTEAEIQTAFAGRRYIMMGEAQTICHRLGLISIENLIVRFPHEIAISYQLNTTWPLGIITFVEDSCQSLVIIGRQYCHCMNVLDAVLLRLRFG